MNKAKTQQLLLTSAAVTFVIGGMGYLGRDEIPSLRFFVGVAATFATLSILSDVGAGRAASLFAILIMVSAIIAEGENAFSYINGLLKKQKHGLTTGAPSVL